MGVSTDGILAYGYNLGGAEDEWLVEEADDGSLHVPWWPEDSDEDFATAAGRALLASVGFTETWEFGQDGYWDREKEAQARVGVMVEEHCSGEYPLYILAAKVITARRGYPEVVDMSTLGRQAVDDMWDAKLAIALRALGLTPKQERPGWILASYWG